MVKFSKRQILIMVLVCIFCWCFRYVSFNTSQDGLLNSFINKTFNKTTDVIEQSGAILDSTSIFESPSELEDSIVTSRSYAEDDMVPEIADMTYDQVSFQVNVPVNFFIELAEQEHSTQERTYFVEVYSVRPFGDFLVASDEVTIPANETFGSKNMSITFDTLGELNTTVKIYNKEGGTLLLEQMGTRKRSVNYKITSEEQLTGIDTYSPLTKANCTALKEKGISFVARYYSSVNGNKCIDLEEAQNICNAGMQLVTVYQDGNNTKSAFTYNNGYNDCKAAIDMAIEIGQPITSPIYFAVDFEANSSTISNVYKYFDGVTAAMNEFKASDAKGRYWRIGVYGSYYVVESVQKKGYASYAWQTAAWSYDKKYAAYDLYQSVNDYEICGLMTDKNLSNPANGNNVGGFFITK